MIRRAALPAGAAALLLLTGAGQASDGFALTDATSQQVADAYAAAKPGGPMHHGQWQRSYRIAAFELPGQPAGPDRDAKVAAAKAQDRDESVCHDGDDLAAPEPAKVFEMLGVDCHYAQMTMRGGRFDGQLACKDARDPAASLAIGVSGTYGPDAFTIRMMIDAKRTDPKNDMRLTMDIAGHRTGDCAAQ